MSELNKFFVGCVVIIGISLVFAGWSLPLIVAATTFAFMIEIGMCNIIREIRAIRNPEETTDDAEEAPCSAR